jgi:ubiquinone/menaquinone biosynthesis C-methylase UbiE
MEAPDLETSGDGYATRFSGDVGRYFLDIQERSVVDFLKKVPGRTVLDVGGAHGQIAVPLRREGYDVTVYGSSAACHRNLARRSGRDAASRYVVGDLLKLPFRDRSFDTVVSFRLLPHVVRWTALVEELARVARNGVMVDFPTVWSVNVFTPLLFRLKKRIERNTRPYTLFTTGSVRETFRRSGFRVLGAKGQFILPMALHRWTGLNRVLVAAESGARESGITDRIGSPVILFAVRENIHSPGDER